MHFAYITQIVFELMQKFIKKCEFPSFSGARGQRGNLFRRVTPVGRGHFAVANRTIISYKNLDIPDSRIEMHFKCRVLQHKSELMQNKKMHFAYITQIVF